MTPDEAHARRVRVREAKLAVARALAPFHDLTQAEITYVLSGELLAHADGAVHRERTGPPPPRADVRCTCGWAATAPDPDDAFADHIATMTAARDVRTHRITGVYMLSVP
ncbi:MAG: hypothetical protein IPJ61_18895 [Tessaracoccus sp.]|uniref:hypothetical protein n=1 Tax=Tessaracoccus sp. TaxID=1971211 RepID=UPI001ECA1878|nr:hypothetical protein [Tessaracoccus sp.]MBK7823054.1 hypothetical protein [Tessaracoccus sp.]